MGAWLLLSVQGPRVRGHPQWSRSALQGSRRGMGPDLPVLRLDREGLVRVRPIKGPGRLRERLPAGELKSRKLNAEIANGRLAMMAIIGMFYQDGLTGSAWGDWELYADSPLR